MSPSSSSTASTTTSTTSTTLTSTMTSTTTAVATALAAAAAGAAFYHLLSRLARTQERALGAGKRVAVVACGAGYLDGSEVLELAAVLTAASEFGASVRVFAPERAQADVVDHQSVKALGYAPRIMTQETARVTRGGVRDLATLRASEFDAVVFPGGFGVAKSLSTWASKGAECTVDEHAARVLREFHDAGKPIGCSCIAPVLLAKTLAPVRITVGKAGPEKQFPYGGTVAQVTSIAGVENVPADATQVVVDHERRVVTTPAYMENAERFAVWTGVRGMVKEVLRMS